MPNIFDFNPTSINPFPYWKWNKVLPAVYDDSLSQYEILCKLLNVVNNIIESTNSTGEQVEQLTQLVQQLIDGEFPSGIVQYVTDIANAAIDEDVEAINASIQAISNEVESYKNSIDKSSSGHRQVNIGANYAPSKLINAFTSFIPHNDMFVYGAGSFLGEYFNPDTNLFEPITINGFNDNGVAKFYVSCSTAVDAALMGIHYETSRMATGTIVSGNPPTLVGGTNRSVSGGAAINVYDQTLRLNYGRVGSAEAYFIEADGLAHWLYDAGYLRFINNVLGISQLAAGDIVFWKREAADSWNHIDHVGIYCGPWFTGGMIAEVINDGNGFRISNRTIDSATYGLQNIAAFARIPMQGQQPKPLINGNFATGGYDYSNDNNVQHGIQFQNDAILKPNSVYTVVIDISNLSGTNPRLSIRGYHFEDGDTGPAAGSVANINMGNELCYLGNNRYWGVLKVPNIEQTVNGIDFIGAADSSNWAFHIDNIEVYDGVITPC